MLYADDVYEDDKEILTDDEKELHEVSRNGDLNMVKELLRNKVNPNALDEKERSPLHLASGQGHVDVIKELLNGGAKIETADIYGMNAVMWAAWFGRVEVMKLLRQEGANMEVVNKRKLWSSKLMFEDQEAILDHRGTFPKVTLTSERWLDTRDIPLLLSIIDSLPKAGLTVVHCASTRGNLEVLQYLVREVFVEEGFDDEETFLDSVGGKVSDILGGAGMFMGLGRKFTSNSNIFKEKLRPENSTLERREKKGSKTALHLAAEQGHVDVLEYLIKAKCNKHALTGDSSTSIHLAARTGMEEVVLLLLENKLDINAKNKEGKTPLHIAAEAGQAEMVKLLLEKSATASTTAAKEMAAIHFAAKHNHVDVIRAIGSFNTNIDVPSEGGNTALHLAASLGNLEAVQALVSCGANINSVNTKNRTALHEVTENGFTDIVEYLLVEGAAVDVVDKLGKTALLMAIRAENITITDMIIKAERYYEGIKQGKIDGSRKATTFRHERTPQQKQMKPFCYDLAMKELEEDDLRRLFFHWRFKELHVKAIQSQYIGNKSWREHAYRVLLIWLHGCDENPLKELYETLVTAGRKKLADKLRMRANKLAQKSNGNCVVS